MTAVLKELHRIVNEAIRAAAPGEDSDRREERVQELIEQPQRLQAAGNQPKRIEAEAHRERYRAG